MTAEGLDILLLIETPANTSSVAIYDCYFLYFSNNIPSKLNKLEKNTLELEPCFFSPLIHYVYSTQIFRSQQKNKLHSGKISPHVGASITLLNIKCNEISI